MNQVLQGIADALKTEFGLRVMAADVEQGLNAPCFFVQMLDTAVKPFPSRRSRWTQPFDVLYFPAPDEERTRLYIIGARALRVLEMISVGGSPLLGRNRHFEIVDGVLHVFVTYSRMFRETDEQDPMEELETTIGKAR